MIPIPSAECTKRILRPLDESHFEFLVHQGLDLNLRLRLMARRILIDRQGGSTVIFNNPVPVDGYREFRQRLLHLPALNQSGDLFIQSLIYEEAYPVALDRAMTPEEIVAALDKGYRWTSSPGSAEPQLTRKIQARLVIANYNPKQLGGEERRSLNDMIAQDPRDWIFVDIKPGFPEGDYPFQGKILLRSFNAILGFLARREG
jgi:hypothetical protein